MLRQNGDFVLAYSALEVTASRPDSDPVVPEPASLAIWSLLAVTGIGFAGWRRRRTR
jgi:hypothetical protein